MAVLVLEAGSLDLERCYPIDAARCARRAWRDELGISDTLTARPVQAALASAGTFAIGAVLPLLVVILFPASVLMWAVSGSSLRFLALLGSLAARAGGAPVITAAARATFWGAMAMALTAGVGALFGSPREIRTVTDLDAENCVASRLKRGF